VQQDSVTLEGPVLNAQERAALGGV